MSRNIQSNYRIGSFAAVNTGKISGCSANLKFKTKHGGAGFVHDNRGEILNCFSGKPPRGQGKLAGFVSRDSGYIKNCGFVANGRAKKVESAANQKQTKSFQDFHLFLGSNLSTEEIYKQLELQTVWKNDSMDSLEPDMKLNHVSVTSATTAIEIDSADKLLEIISAVNDGDAAAASAHYILTDNINMHGKTIDPLGRSEMTAFRGILDGNGKTIANFVINGKGCEYAGFIGVAMGAQVINLELDCILKSHTGKVTGGMVALNHNSLFENCVVCISLNPGICSGGFVGKNGGTIRNCYVCGKISFPIILWPLWLIPLLLLLLLALLLLLKDRSGDVGYVPEIIDPNAAPVFRPDDIPKPEAGTSRISFEVFQEIYVGAETMVGEMGYVNPARATQDVVVRICISDSELTAAGYDLTATGVRTAEELAAAGYVPEEAFTELYRSGRIEIGYGIDNCKLSPLPNGEKLKIGEYEMVIFIDSYDPETFEKSIINANVPIAVHIVAQ